MAKRWVVNYNPPQRIQTNISLKNDSFFTFFETSINAYVLPERFTFPFAYTPHPLCILAAKQLQQYLTDQTALQHNFGLTAGEEENIIGKMFGVLLVETAENKIGYLSAFSGKLAGSNHHAKFVPPVFDLLAEGGFLNKGMKELSRMGQTIKLLEENSEQNKIQIEELKAVRKKYSNTLQEEIFDHYHFLNQLGEEKSLREIFKENDNKKPPSGAGECAAPKLLQYAFQHNMKPLAIAEFWWGQSPKSETWKHGEYYPSCHEKCEPILAHMLKGIEMDERPQ